MDQLLSQKLVEFKTDVTLLHTCIESKGEGSSRISKQKLGEVPERKVQSPQSLCIET